MPSVAQVPAAQWVILGYPVVNGYAVIGSTTLTSAELRYRADLLPPWEWSDSVTKSAPVELTVRMPEYVVCIARTYRGALMQLMGSWNPDEVAELPGARPEISR